MPQNPNSKTNDRLKTSSVGPVASAREIDELLRLAGVASSDEKAVSWLEEALRGATAIYRAARRRPLPADHDKLLIDIAKQARKLSKLLHRLQPSSWYEFWVSFEHSRPNTGRMVEHDDDENSKRLLQRMAVRRRRDRAESDDRLSIVRRIERAAETAVRAKDTGRPTEIGKQRVVDLALAFFLRNSPIKPSGTRTGAFAKFARAFFVAATKLDLERHGGLDRQIRQALKALPAERQRKARLSQTRALSR